MDLTPLDRLRRDRVLALRDLAEAVAGEPIRGSWWGHAKGGAIYAAAQALEASPEVLVTRLGGRVTFVHRALWPLLARVVTDRAWRARTVAALPGDARDLLAEVEAKGEVRNPPKKAREALERRLLALGQEVHEGRHVVVLKPWHFEGLVEGSFDEAVRALAAAGIAL